MGYIATLDELYRVYLA